MASQSQIKAGGAYVEISTKDSTKSGFDKVTKRLKAWGAGIAAVGSKVFAAGMAIDAAVDGMVLQFASAGSNMAKLSSVTGIGVENLSTLGFAADQTGVDMDTLTAGIKKMEKTIAEAAGGSKEAQQHLAQLGLTVSDLAALSPDEQFLALAQAISKVPNLTQRAAEAMQIFGRNGTALLPMLNRGADGIREMQQVARDWGLEMSGKDAAAAVDLSKTLKLLAAVVKMIVFEVGAAAAPAFAKMRDTIAPIVRDTLAWIKGNTGLVVSITKIGLLVAGVGAAIMVLGYAFSAVGAIIGTVSAVVSAVLSPWVLIPALVAGAVGALLYFSESGQQLFAAIAADAQTAFGGIADALRAGDVKLAAQILWATLKLEWQRGTAYLSDRWEAFKAFFAEGWYGLAFVLANGLVSLFYTLKGVWDSIINSIKAGWVSAKALATGKSAFEAGKAGGEAFAGYEAQDEAKRREDEAKTRQRVQGNYERMIDDAGRKAKAATNQADIDAAAAELDALRKQAAEAAALAKNTGKAPPGVTGIDPLAIQAKADVAGSFSAAAAGRMGFGESLAAKMLSAMDRTADASEEMAAGIGAFGALA